MDAFIGEIRLMAFEFAPKYWALCNGALLPIAQNQALFSLLGTAYGGNGQTNFALPDLRGRSIVGAGPSLFGSTYTQGQIGGVESVTLTAGQLPQHVHPMYAYNGAPDADGAVTPPSPTATLAQAVAKTADGDVGVNRYAASGASGTLANPLNTSGGNQPHNNRQPYLSLSYCICTQGIFPPRN